MTPSKLGLSIALLLLLGGCVSCSGSDLAPGVTAASIRALQLGMTEAQVTGILGAPFLRGSDDNKVCESDGGACEVVDDSLLTLVYFRRVPRARSYPELWVYLRDGQVEEVLAKRVVHWASDEGVYVLNARMRWESPEFVATFPK